MEIVCWLSKIRLAALAWSIPWMALRLMSGTLLLIALRWGSDFLEIIPGYLSIDLAFIFGFAFAAWWGPAGVWALVIATFSTELLWGSLWPDGLFHAAAALVVSWLGMVTGQYISRKPVVLLRSHMAVFIGLIVAAFSHALWVGMGYDLMRAYPFGYTGRLLVFHDLALGLLIAWPMLFYGRNLCASWHKHLQREPETRPSLLGTALIIIGLAGGIVATLLVALIFDDRGPFESSIIGEYAGNKLWLSVSPFLLLQALGFCWPYRRRPSQSGLTQSRLSTWQSLMD